MCTAVAGGGIAWLLLRFGAEPLEALGGAFVAGTMSSVWLNATETEVYAASLLLAVVTVVAGECAGRRHSARRHALLAYLIVLAVPLHLSALVAAPAAIYAATADVEGRVRWREAVALAGAVAVALALSRASAWFALVGVVLLASAPRRGRLLVVAGVAASALLILLLRARLDPWLDQGNPSTWRDLADVIARRQYAVAPPWPRRAPLWLQVANLAQYADWQVALSLGREVFASVPRLLGTLLFVALGAVGAARHHARDRRGFTTVLLLLVAGTFGVLLYLNLQAGPSLGYGIVPDGAHEARERDYFFVVGFAAWGMWAGMGAIALGDRLMQPAASLALAAIPCALNWSAVSRTRHPEAGLPSIVAESLLGAAPANAVLFAGGDNDTYPLWAAQAAGGMRRDVTVVTIPLLPATWYRRELARRYELLPPQLVDAWGGEEATLRAIRDAAGKRGRPVAASPQLGAGERARVASSWLLRGPIFIADGRTGAQGVAVDTAAARTYSRAFERWRQGRSAPPAIDPTTDWWLRLLSCPGALVHRPPAPPETGGAHVISDSLDSTCNLR